MKTCKCCGEEIFTRDGNNLCAACQEDRSRMRRVRAREQRRARREVLESLGLRRVRGGPGRA